MRVTNEDKQPRQWNVEPYGDEVSVQPKDSLRVEVGDGPDVLIEIRLHPEGVGDALWINVNGQPVVPSDLRRNDRSLWPSR